MVAKSLVAILAGFAIAVPTTFWLLKKVRIKSKVRHFQVSLALGLPTALFIYLLQTSFALPIVIITVAFSLLVVALELTLRRLVSKLPASRIGLDNGRIGSGVAFDEARECFDRLQHPHQGMVALFEWALCKFEADEMMVNLNKHWPRLHGQMNGKVGAI